MSDVTGSSNNDNAPLRRGDASGSSPGSVVAFPRAPEQRTPENNLPLELSSFIGREKEIAEVKGLLATTRLLTLTGPGGCGKTRLALRVAADVLEGFEDGVWLVELAPLSDPTLVPQSVAGALKVREVPGRPLTQTLVDALRSKRMLLVLDNCEHLIEATARFVQTVLTACPRLSFLSTSRETLGIAGETVWLVPSLSVPDPGHSPPVEELARYEAIRLFAERAKAVVPTFEITEHNASGVARVCRRLDGMPLAIELAAARVRVLSVEQIAGRLEDCFRLLRSESRTAPPRQKTLWATIGWSHALLSEEEQVLFRRLAVFAGGFTLEAAEEVCAGQDLRSEDVLDLLSRLVDKSMVVSGAGDEGALRYRMLEPTRQYGLQKLGESGEAELLRERHEQYYLRLAEEAQSELREQGAWLERLGTEHANLRAALGWSLGPEDAEEHAGERAQLGLRLAAVLAQARFWSAYGPSEGRRWLERGLARSGASSKPVRAKALREAGWLATHQGDYERAVALLEESMELFKELEDKPGVASSLVHLGNMALHGGDHGRARELRQEAEVLRWELADQQAIGLLLYFLAFAALDEGDHDRAVALAEEGLALSRELGDLLGSALCLTVLGVTALDRGDSERAAALYEEDMRVLQRLRDKLGIAYGLRGLAAVASLRDQPARAARLWGAAEALGEAIGLPLSPFDRSHPDYEGLLAAARSQLAQAAWEAARAEGWGMTPEEAIEYALLVEEQTATPKESALLSERELEVLRLVAEGLTDPQVAQRLYLSPRTVGWHLHSIYRKLGVPSRAAAAKAALERGLI